MEAFLIVVLVGGLLLLPYVLSIVALVKAGRARRLSERLLAIDDSLTDTQRAVARMHNEWQALREQLERRGEAGALLTHARRDQAAMIARAPEPLPVEVTAPDVHAPAPTPPPTLAPSTTAPVAELPVAAPPVAAPQPPAPAPEVEAQAVAAQLTPPPAPAPLTPEPPPAQRFADEATVPTAAESVPEPEAEPTRAHRSLEELLGGQVALKLGVVFVVIGVVFFLGRAVLEMGPLGKVLTGYGIGALLLTLGLLAERRPRYETFGRALLAGAWGVLYFVTFAAHFIPLARIIDHELVAVVALLVAAGGAVGFSLRYDNEWTTTFAFLLIFTTLALAAFRTDATFNLGATAIIAAALAFLVWRRSWDRLLTIGIVCTWGVLAAWIMTSVVSPGAVARGAELTQVSLSTLLGPLAATWAAFQAAVLWRHQGREARQTWIIAGYLANTAGGFGLMMVLVQTMDRPHAWLAALVFGLLYLGGAWGFRARQRRLLYLISGTVGLAALALVTPLRLGADSHWVPLSRMVGLEVVLVAGCLLKERFFRWLVYAVFAFTFYVDLLGLKLAGAPLTLGGLELNSRLVLFPAATLIAFVNLWLVRRPLARWLGDQEKTLASLFFSASGALLLLVLLLKELPDPLIAPVLAAVALGGTLIGRRVALRDLVVEAAGYAAVTAAAMGEYTFTLVWPPDAPPMRLITLAGTALLLVGAWTAARTRRAAHPIGAWLTGAGVVHALVALIALAALIFLEAPAVWVGPLCAAALVVYLAGARRLGWAELFYLAGIWLVLALIGIGSYAWPLEESLWRLPARLVGVGATLALFYVAVALLTRLGRARAEADAPLPGFPSRGVIDFGGVAVLALTTLLAAVLVKAEALRFDKNLLVALLWGVGGIVYLEVARLRRARRYFVHGHALLLAAVVHLFLVNFVQPGMLGPVSLRLATVAPFFAFLLFVYNGWRGTTAPLALPDRADELRFTYLYVLTAVVATGLLYELHRAWVIVSWALVALVMLWRWQATGNRHWRICSLLLVLSTVARIFAVNLYFRDELVAMRLNLVTVPLAALILLAGYALVRRGELAALGQADAAESRDLAGALGRQRMLWLAALTAAMTGFVWVELSGPLFTVALSVEGLALVALGFVAKERLARLTGIGTLAICVVKLFVDLWGMEGVPWFVPFLVVGTILITVGFVYTRFKERLQELF